MFMTVYLALSSAIFALLSLIWQTSDWANALIRAVLISMAVAGGFTLMNQLGYIVKI